MGPMNCLFCKIANGQIPSHKVYEDAAALAFLDVNPLTRGHALVIPKRHAEKLEDLSPAEAEKLMGVLHKLLPALAKAVGATASNVALNNGRESGQEVPHLHVHLIPRTPGDGGASIHAAFSKRAAAAPPELARLAEQVSVFLK